jgi:ATP synthase protein I
MMASGEDGGGDERPGRSVSDEEAALAGRLRALQGKLQDKRATDRYSGAPRQSAGTTGMGQALRIGSEFAAGVLVGAAIGWAVDRWLGTSPFGLIVFLLLGFAAGLLNVLRLAGLVKTPTLPPKDGSDA